MSAAWWLVTVALWVGIFAVALTEQVSWDRAHSAKPLCPCPKGCGRPVGEHVEPYAALIKESF